MNQEELSIAAIRALGIDMINKANSGHPGMVLGSAPALYTLFTKELSVFPKQSDWFNRDRFVLASGHASALLYSLLHLSGFDLDMDDLKQFRQLNSRTPGHPECDITDGVDASSGPLGQGIPMAIGMAMSERFLATRYNKEGYEIVNHYTYALCGDGDMQEGVTYEASSLAGHLSLGKLIVLYDANKVTLDGPLDFSFSEDVKKRYEAMNWQVIKVTDGNDINAIHKAIKKGKREKFKPTLIMIDTEIGYGSQNSGTSKVHGAPLGQEDGCLAKKKYCYEEDEFCVVDSVYEDFNKNVYNRGKRAYNRWNRLVKAYKNDFPDEFEELFNAIDGKFDVELDELLNTYEYNAKEATRITSEKIINEIAKQNPTFLSGTADLASSTKTMIYDGGRFSCEDYSGRNLYYGIREFAMVSIMNGMTLHKGVKVASGGFLVFSDYFKAAVRMACLMKLPIILPLSHDSIAVGEDGPTHQPVEQLLMLRSIPNMRVLRPADAAEMCAAWKLALQSQDAPTALILTRQDVPNITQATVEDVSRGGYIVSREQNECDGIIIASGSEVSLAIDAQKELLKQGKDIRVVSMVSTNLFEQQSDEYKNTVLPKHLRKRLAVEMATDLGWHKYVGLDGDVLCVDRFGASGPADVVIPHYGFTVENVVDKYLNL